MNTTAGKKCKQFLGDRKREEFRHRCQSTQAYLLFVVSALISFFHQFGGYILLLLLMHIKNPQELWGLILSWCLDGFFYPIYQNNICVIRKLDVQGSCQNFPFNSKIWFAEKTLSTILIIIERLFCLIYFYLFYHSVQGVWLKMLNLKQAYQRCFHNSESLN